MTKENPNFQQIQDSLKVLERLKETIFNTPANQITNLKPVKPLPKEQVWLIKRKMFRNQSDGKK